MANRALYAEMTRQLAPEEPFDEVLAYLSRQIFHVNYLLDEIVWNGENTRELMEAVSMNQVPSDEVDPLVPNDDHYRLRLRPLYDRFAVHTGEAIPANRRIMTVFGEVFQGHQKQEMDENCIRLPSNFVVCFERQGAIFSHVRASCNANCKLEFVWKNGVEYAVVVSTRDIVAGEEVTVDFNYSVPYGVKNMKCHCGAGKKCRRVKAFPRDNLERHLCRLCNHSFPTTHDKYEHILVQHVHGGQIQCPHVNCNRHFFHSSNYYNHLAKCHHGVDPIMPSGKPFLHDYPCENCGHQSKGPDGWAKHKLICKSSEPCDCKLCENRNARLRNEAGESSSEDDYCFEGAFTDTESEEDVCADQHQERRRIELVNTDSETVVEEEDETAEVNQSEEDEQMETSPPQDTQHTSLSRSQKSPSPDICRGRKPKSTVAQPRVGKSTPKSMSVCSSTSYHTDDIVSIPHSQPASQLPPRGRQTRKAVPSKKSGTTSTAPHRYGLRIRGNAASQLEERSPVCLEPIPEAAREPSPQPPARPALLPHQMFDGQRNFYERLAREYMPCEYADDDEGESAKRKRNSSSDESGAQISPSSKLPPKKRHYNRRGGDDDEAGVC